MLNEIWTETGSKPAALQTRPALIERWDIAYRVWKEVSGSRNHTSGGAAEVPFSEFFLWAAVHEYSRGEMQSMWEDVHTLDKIFLSVSTKFQKAQEDSKKKA